MANHPAIDFDLLRAAIHAALRAWRKLDGTPHNQLENLILVQAERQVGAEQAPNGLRLAANQVLLNGIDELAKENKLWADILRFRFAEDEQIRQVAVRLGQTQDQIKHAQASAITRLTQIILEEETNARRTRTERLIAALPPLGYGVLFGAKASGDLLTEQLLDPEAPPVVAITGIGGIGKSSLAHHVAARVIPHHYFRDVIWVHLDAPATGNRPPLGEEPLNQVQRALANRLLPPAQVRQPVAERQLAVRQALKRQPHLVIVDNLEDAGVTDYLLVHLKDLATPSKFLVTTRTRPGSQAGVFDFPLHQLPFKYVIDFVRHYAREIGFDDLAAASEGEITPIYEAVGGNPFAVKLVVGLAAIMPLQQVLADLISVQSGDVEELYRSIFWQAWQTLTAPSRQLLEKMVLASDVGLTPDDMAFMSELNAAQLWPAISELVNRSLLDVRGTTWDRRYGIHRLTQTFLCSEIIHWPEDV